jgi:uncharacterized membrane protein
MSVNLRRVMLAVAILGLALAAYLTYVHYSGTRPACTAGDACTKVQTSVYSKIGGVPVALIGLIGYIGIVGSLLLPDRDDTRLLTLVMTVIGVCFSGYLTYREVFTLKTICEECATSAVLMLLLFLGAATRYVMGDPMTSTPAGPAASPVTGGKPPARQKIAS